MIDSTARRIHSEQTAGRIGEEERERERERERENSIGHGGKRHTEKTKRGRQRQTDRQTLEAWRLLKKK